ncbi:MAG TPA: BlaI/MecI/CopY family transcriptional regulator [Longimicrobiales bacterium]|nr:BlaI/MecI/CopY family transcriptional regulator [Longimicrobiales bacterium]
MARSPYLDLSRRERQIMDAIYRLGVAAVSDVLAEIPDPPTYSSVRAMMGKLEEKGHLTHEQDGARYVYSATQPRGEARATALRRVMRTFFDGSPSKAVAAVLDVSDGELSDEELDELTVLIENARRRGG